MGIATILFLVPLIALAILISVRTSGIAFRLAMMAGLLLGIIAGTSPCWVHNYFIAKDPVFLSAHSGVNFWIGNNPTATGYPRFPPGLHAGQEVMLRDSINAAEKAAGRSLKRSEVSAYWSGKARAYIHNHFGEWLKLVGTKIKNFWNAFQYDDLSMITALREHRVIFPGIRFGIVAALALPGLILAWRRYRASRWIAAAIFLHMCALLPVFITERYRLAAVPGLLLFAACGLSIFWQAVANYEFRTVAAYVTLLLASTLFVSWPQREPSLWALDNYNSGWQALEAEDYETAERKLNLAYQYVPENAETNFAIGNLHLAKHEPTAAKSYYAATLRLDPSHEGAYNNLGVLALQEERWDVAVSFFQRALLQNPGNAKTFYLLAQAHFNAGDFDNAKAEITQALKLNPKPPEFRDLQSKIEAARQKGTIN
jgi:tetratricopeptide (TPR) repeat protein